MSGSEQKSTHRAIERVARESYVAWLHTFPRIRGTWGARRMPSVMRWWQHSKLGRETACHKIQRRGC